MRTPMLRTVWFAVTILLMMLAAQAALMLPSIVAH